MCQSNMQGARVCAYRGLLKLVSRENLFLSAPNRMLLTLDHPFALSLQPFPSPTCDCEKVCCEKKSKMSDTSYFVAGPSSQPYSSEARQLLFSVVAAIAKGQGYDGIDSSAMDYILNRLESCESTLMELPSITMLTS
jgi:hypothetical protein